MNVTEQDPLTGEERVLSFGILNASTSTGEMEVGVVSRGVIEIHTVSGSVQLTVSNSFSVSPSQTKPNQTKATARTHAITQPRKLAGCHAATRTSSAIALHWTQY
jgi:hypothetical protein